MCDPLVELLLKQWGVPQLQDRCKEQEVDLDALRSLKEDMVSELVPLIGPRSKFLGGWKEWKSLGAPAPLAAPSASAASPAPWPCSPLSPEAPEHGAARPPPPSSLPATMTCSNVPSAPHSRAEQLDFSARSTREVRVFLEGKITYEDGNNSAGSLVADGYLSTEQLPWGHTWGSQHAPHGTSIKAEPTGAEEDHGLPEQLWRPRFQLQGRITLSSQDFEEVPSFMLAGLSPMNVDDGCSLTASSSSRHDLTTPGSEAETALSCDATPTTTTLNGPAPGRPGPSAKRGSLSFRPTVVASPPRQKRARAEKLDLQAMLNRSSKGKMVLSLYKQRGSLDGSARQTLTDLIIAEELREDFNKRITSQRFQEIAESIVELFPGENEDTYFSNDRSYSDRPGGKGKLTSKYYNTRRQLAKSGVISRAHNKERRQMLQQVTITALQSSPEEEEAAKQSFKWIQNEGMRRMNLSPKALEVTLEKWKGCWKQRMVRVLSSGHNPGSYLDEFAVLRTPQGEKLIKADYDILFKNTGSRLLNDWPTFSQTVISMLSEDYRKQLPLLDCVRRNLTSAEGKQTGAFLLLPSMLPVTTCKGLGDSGELWRPTRQEAQDGFLLHVERDVDVSAALERHWARMRLMGQTVGPLPVVVGHSLDDLSIAMVAVDEDTAFYVPNALCAVDYCFKCFHALQVPYPPQAQNVWLFLQHALYQLATPNDRMSVAVSSLLADFGFRPVAPVASWDQVLH